MRIRDPPPLHPHHGAHGLGMSVPRETQGSFDEEVGPRVGASNHGGWFLYSFERFSAKQSAVRRCLPTGEFTCQHLLLLVISDL